MSTCESTYLDKSIYLTPYQEAICTDNSEVLLCKAGRRIGTTTGFANLCRDYVGKDDLIVLFCSERDYSAYRKIIYPSSYTQECAPENITHRAYHSQAVLDDIIYRLKGCRFKRCIVVSDNVLLSQDFEDFIEVLKRYAAEVTVRVQESNHIDLRYKGWYNEDGSYRDTFAGMNFKMISGEWIDV